MASFDNQSQRRDRPSSQAARDTDDREASRNLAAGESPASPSFGYRINPQAELSENFCLTQFTKSPTAKKYDLYNIPLKEIELENLKALCEYALEPIRALFGREIIITSGFRCGTLNRLMGGSFTSQHLYGEAVDFIVRGELSLDATRRIAESSIPFDQLRYEARRRGNTVSEWVHISHRRKGLNRREVFSVHWENNKRKELDGVAPLTEAVYG